MRKITAFNLSIGGYVIRFYTMIAAVVILGFIGQFELATIAGNILAVTYILGIRFEKVTKQVKVARDRQLRKEEREITITEAA